MAVAISAAPGQGIYTFQDAIEHLVMFGRENTSRRFRTDIVNAVVQAYEEVGAVSDWEYFKEHLRIKIPARVNWLIDTYTHGVGTITERELKSATDFPDWIKYARIKDNDIVYEVQDQLASDLVNLTADKNPGEDRSAETWTIYQNRFPLPRDFRRMSAPFSAESWGAARKTSLEDMVWKERYDFYSGSTRTYAIVGNSDGTGGMSLVIDPPEPEETVDFVYVRAPRRLKLTGETFPLRGVDATANGTGVTLPSANTSNDMLGAFIRLGTAAVFPTGVGGDSPYSEQRRIVAVVNATTLIVDSPWSGTYSSGTGYAITDPIDMPYACRDAFWRCCEYKLGIVRQMQSVTQLNKTWIQALRLAKERDAVDSRRRYAKGWPDRMGNFSDWRVNV